MLKEIFGPNREEVAGDWRRLHNEELCKFHASQNIIRMMKRTIRLTGNVERKER